MKEFPNINFKHLSLKGEQVLIEKMHKLFGTGKYFLMKNLWIGVTLFALMTISVQGQSKYGWYTEGDNNIPTRRTRITVTNPLNIPCENCPVVVHRSNLSLQNIPVRWINLVDPNLPENLEPTREELMKNSGYTRRAETNGHYVNVQVDDINKNGIWDELFFITDLAPKETRDFYIYMDDYERGMIKHLVHANIGDFGRHVVPFWESEHMGWKLWYPNAVDLHGKLKPMLTAYYEYSTNQSGYYMPRELGNDIMSVHGSFGSGGMTLFENPDDPENPARPYFSPTKNQGPFMDTRFAYDVVYNGPLRSMIKETIMNWNSGQGFYELEQYYTAVAHKSWSIVEVKFTEFLPPNNNIMFGAGIRKIMKEYKSVKNEGMVISMGKDIESRIPDEDIGDEVVTVPWQGIGLVVKEKLKPEYVSINNHRGNHLFKIPVTPNLSYQYMIVGGWSFNEVNNNEKDFIKYVETEALKYNNPPIVEIHEFELKGQ